MTHEIKIRRKATDTNPAHSLNIVRKQLTELEINDPAVRVNPSSPFQVQRTHDGGSTWVDSPTDDPRHTPGARRPPRTGSARRCDAAANATAWIKQNIDALELSLFGSALATAIVPLLFIAFFGPIGVVLDLLIGALAGLESYSAGTLNAAFTTTHYTTIENIIYCHMDDDGQISATALAAIKSDIDAQLGGTIASVLDILLPIWGEVGLSNAGAVGTEVGSCGSFYCFCPGGIVLFGGNGYPSPWNRRSGFGNVTCTPYGCSYDGTNDKMVGCLTTINNAAIYAEASYPGTPPLASIGKITMRYSAHSSRSGVGAFIEIYDHMNTSPVQRYVTSANAVAEGDHLTFTHTFTTPLTISGDSMYRLYVGANAGSGQADLEFLELCPP